MGLETYTFPNVVIEAALSIPEEHLLPGAEASAADYLLSLEFDEPVFVGSQRSVIVRMKPDQLHVFQSELSEPTPQAIHPPEMHQLNRFGVAQLALAASIGMPLSIADVRNGTILQDIFPTEANQSVASSSYGSEEAFVFHNDQSYLDDPEIPDYVTLGCIRNLEGAATMVADVKSFIRSLKPGDVAELQKPNYVFRHTYHRGQQTERKGIKYSPALPENGEIRVGVDMTPTTTRAQLALENLRTLLRQSAIPYLLSPGEILVTPNRYTVHARDAFRLMADPAQRRWLQRVNIRDKEPNTFSR